MLLEPAFFNNQNFNKLSFKQGFTMKNNKYFININGTSNLYYTKHYVFKIITLYCRICMKKLKQLFTVLKFNIETT